MNVQNCKYIVYASNVPVFVYKHCFPVNFTDSDLGSSTRLEYYVLPSFYIFFLKFKKYDRIQ